MYDTVIKSTWAFFFFSPWVQAWKPTCHPSPSPVRVASHHCHLILCLLKKNLKMTLPVEFPSKNLKNKMFPQFLELGTNATNWASFEMSVFSFSGRANCLYRTVLCTTWWVISADISTLLLYTILSEQGIALILKQFCLQTLLMHFLLQRVSQTPHQWCTVFYTLWTQRNIIGCTKTFPSNFLIFLSVAFCSLLINIVFTIEKILCLFIDEWYEVKCFWSKRLHWLDGKRHTVWRIEVVAINVKKSLFHVCLIVRTFWLVLLVFLFYFRTCFFLHCEVGNTSLWHCCAFRLIYYIYFFLITSLVLNYSNAREKIETVRNTLLLFILI